MRSIYAWLLLAAPLCAHAQSFTARSEAGDSALATSEGEEYQQKLMPELVRAVHGCIVSEARLEPGTIVTVVAEIGRDGSAANLQALPDIGSGKCIQQRLRAYKFPPPSRWEWSRGALPITLRFGITKGIPRGSEGAAR